MPIGPSRIVSLCPAATETLGLLGGSSLLVGRSHRCDLPNDVMDRPVLTAETAESADSGARGVDIGRLRACGPDLVIVGRDVAGHLESMRAALGESVRFEMYEPTTVEDVFEFALTLGRVLGREDAAVSAVVGLRERFYRACEFVTPFEEGPRVAVLTGLDPLEVGGWWIPQLVERAGGSFPLNPTVAKAEAGAAAGFAHSERRAGAARGVSVDELLGAGIEALVVCVPGVGLEGVRAGTARLAGEPWWGAIPAVRSGRVALVDGLRGLVRPGPGLVEGFTWLVGWLNGREGIIPPGVGEDL
ncbi:MAG: ABC transporter substrate-binding protein [Phycisphaeraceae bacterium]|nr:ABC transporter substrate-binding protein [Phycisphaeraceae bacterium]MCB9847255.1 ABC transporter substrate-binding protein [Phycisphaeraceae bacterium]